MVQYINNLTEDREKEHSDTEEEGKNINFYVPQEAVQKPKASKMTSPSQMNRILFEHSIKNENTLSKSTNY